MTANIPEIGKSILAHGFKTNYHDVGQGFPVLFLHGSGPGVSCWSNFGKVFPVVARYARAIGFDLAGFGYTELRPGTRYDLELWVEHVKGFVDAMGLERVAIVGNSAGGTVAAHFAAKYPQHVSRIALMGANALQYKITAVHDFAWGYKPTKEYLAKVINSFPYDKSIITEELLETRFRATLRPEYQAAFESMFPEPRQKIQDSWALSDAQVAAIACEVMLIHGRDDAIVPVDVSWQLAQRISRAQLHVFGQCGHWVQVEKSKEFLHLLQGFLTDAGRP